MLVAAKKTCDGYQNEKTDAEEAKQSFAYKKGKRKKKNKKAFSLAQKNFILKALFFFLLVLAMY